MKYYDAALKMYADNGLRSEQDWASLGRSLKPESKPRTDTMYRGALLPLYSRNQTQIVRRER